LKVTGRRWRRQQTSRHGEEEDTLPEIGRHRDDGFVTVSDDKKGFSSIDQSEGHCTRYLKRDSGITKSESYQELILGSRLVAGLQGQPGDPGAYPPVTWMFLASGLAFMQTMGV